MKNTPHSLPDPVLPEHELITSAGPIPTLSNGLKQRVMLECSHQVRLARWRTRATYGAVVLAACCIILMLRIERPTVSSVPESTAETETQPPENSPGYQSPGAPSSSTIADEKRRKDLSDPKVRAKQNDIPAEAEQIHFLIEELKGRDKKLCGLLPWI